MVNTISPQGSANKNHNRYHFISAWVATIKNVESFDEDIEKLEPSYIASENIKWCSQFGNSFVISQNVKNGAIT